ncbi:MAG: hypothetical protein ACM3NZ_01305 [Betaproteobacteria bacterium]
MLVLLFISMASWTPDRTKVQLPVHWVQRKLGLLVHRSRVAVDNFLTNLTTDLIGRIDGPMQFRIYIQPLMALAFAIRDGRKDVREGRPAYGWAVLTDAAHRGYLLRDGWKGISRVFLLAFVLDLVYQYVALHGWHPLQALLTAVFLALIPYALLRGPVNRLVRIGRREGSVH